MKVYQKVIVAIDLNGGADDVLKKATALLEGSDASITVLNVAYNALQMYGGYMGGSVYSTINLVEDENDIRKATLLKMKAMVEKYRLAGHQLVVDFGRATDVILGHAEKQEADLIIMGSHGRHGLGLLLGSTANAVLHRAKCDVLAVRAQA